MNYEQLVQAVQTLPKDITNLSLITEIETGFDSLFDTLKSVATKSSGDKKMASTINDILSTVHSKIDGALTTFAHLGAIAQTLLDKGEALAATLKYIWNLMITIIHSLKPVEDIVAKLYPVVAPIFDVLNALPAIP